MTPDIPAKRPTYFTPDQKTGWYRPITERQAKARLLMGAADGPRSPVFYVPPKQSPDQKALAVQDSYFLTRVTAMKSEAARGELARKMVDFLIDGGEEHFARFRRLTVLNLKDSSFSLQGRPDLALYEEDAVYGDHDPQDMPWYGDDFPQATHAELEETLRHAELFNYRDKQGDGKVVGFNQPQVDDDQMGKDLATDIVVANALIGIGQRWDDMADPLARAEVAKTLTDQLTPADMVRAFETVEPSYAAAGHDDGGDVYAGERLHIDAVDFATRHWDEVNADNRFPDGINIANGRKRLFPAETIERVATRVEDLEELERAKTAPETSAEIVTLFRPGTALPGP